jgi:hypothetical protein
MRAVARARSRGAARIGGVQELLLPVEQTLVEQRGGGRVGHSRWDVESGRLETSPPLGEHAQTEVLTPAMALMEDLDQFIDRDDRNSSQ